MKSTIGESTNSSPGVAFNQASKDLSNPDMIVFYTTYENLEPIAKIIADKYKDIPSIGTLGTTISGGTVTDDRTIIIGLSGVTAIGGIIENLSKCPIKDIPAIEHNLNTLRANSINTVCLEFCTSEEERLVTVLNSVLEKQNINLIGGSVFGNPEGSDALVAYNGKVYTDASCYCLIKNNTGKIKVYKENIYTKRDDEFHLVTKVDTSTRTLIELDFKPAHQVYTEKLGVAKHDIVGNVMQNPLGRIVGDEVYISSMKSMNPDGSIVNFKQMNENDTVSFLELMDYKKVASETAELIRNDIPKPSLILTIDCIYRYLLFEQDDYLNTHARHLASIGPHVGLIGGGEQYNNQHVNQTMVCVVFE